MLSLQLVCACVPPNAFPLKPLPTLATTRASKRTRPWTKPHLLCLLLLLHRTCRPWLAPGNAVQDVMWNYLDKWKSMVGLGYDFAQPIWTIGVQEGAYVCS